VNDSSLGALAAFLSSCTWAVGSACYSKLSREYRPIDVNFTRAIYALPFFIAAIFLTSGGIENGLSEIRVLEARHFGWFTLSMLSSYVIGDVFFLLSTLSLGVPGALAIASGYPILTALAGAAFDGQALDGTSIFGLLLAVGGIIVVILNDPKGAPSGAEIRAHPLLRKKSTGVLLAVCTAFAWAANSYSVAKGGTGLHPAVGNTIRMSIAIVLITLMSYVTSRQPARMLAPRITRRFAPIIIAESFLGSYLFMYGLSHSTLVLGSTLSSLAPVLSVPVSVALKLERFSWIRTLAVLTVVVGLSLLFR
jgi:drug/metabolite transporter (DMT)-like permease